MSLSEQMIQKLHVEGEASKGSLTLPSLKQDVVRTKLAN